MTEKWGGKREGAGRPRNERVRQGQNMRAHPEEWELIKEFARIVKKDYEKAKKMLEEANN